MSEHLPPVKSFFSTTVTLIPAFASRAAVAMPPAPAPVGVKMSGVYFSLCLALQELHTYDDCRQRLLAQSHDYSGKFWSWSTLHIRQVRRMFFRQLSS